MTDREKITLFNNWLEEKERIFTSECDDDSAQLVQSIKTMFQDVFNL